MALDPPLLSSSDSRPGLDFFAGSAGGEQPRTLFTFSQELELIDLCGSYEI